MAKSDSFFIRAELQTGDSGLFVDTTIPLGSYVDALGQAVLRVHGVEYEWIASDGTAPEMDGNTAGFATFQITTQKQAAMVNLFNKSVVAKGQLWARNPDSATNPPAESYNDSHSPQDFSNGYLVAVETLYLGGIGSTEWKASSNLTCAVVMECTIEKMSQSAAMALSLSQQ